MSRDSSVWSGPTNDVKGCICVVVVHVETYKKRVKGRSVEVQFEIIRKDSRTLLRPKILNLGGFLRGGERNLGLGTLRILFIFFAVLFFDAINFKVKYLKGSQVFKYIEVS